MTSKNLDRLLFVAAIVMAAMLLAGVRLAYAQHECQGGHNCNDGGGDVQVLTELVSGDVSTRALSLGQSLGDVDIAGCIVTSQWGIIIFQRQGWDYDPYCLAEKLDQAGKYEDAAAMRCTDAPTAKLYAERCLTVMNFKPPESNTNTEPSSTSEPQVLVRAQEEDDDEQRREAAMARLLAVEQRLDQDAANRRAYTRQVAVEKRVEQQRAFNAFNAYKAAQQMEEPPHE
ncbi:MAG: hypothetical protein IIC12_06345 [Proteobacteria bacterium]|nr:hypothetical protein [Pseudomonadota bacterium]